MFDLESAIAAAPEGGSLTSRAHKETFGDHACVQWPAGSPEEAYAAAAAVKFAYPGYRIQLDHTQFEVTVFWRANAPLFE